MKDGIGYILASLLGVLFVACEDSYVFPDNKEISQDGYVTFMLQTQANQHIETRADADKYDPDEPIENVYLIVFDASGNKIDMAYQELVENNTSVSMYLKSTAKTVYAVCNLTDTSILDDVTSVANLQSKNLLIEREDGAFQGRFVMTGYVDLGSSPFNKTYYIDLTRTAARLRFVIRKDLPENEDLVEITGVYLHKIPRGTKLLPQDYDETVTLDVDGGKIVTACTNDYVYSTAEKDRQDKYFKSDSILLDLTDSIKTVTESGVTIQDTTYHASYYIFENRQGQLVETDEQGGHWEPIKGFGEEDYKYYRQIYKRGLAQKHDFDYASYLSIHGVYKDVPANNFYDVIYYVYLGSDNYKDFNVRRNHSYTYNITIKSKGLLDTRVVSEYLAGNLEVYGNFADTLDAHPNTVQALLYAGNRYRVWVEHPDQTPWLEVSKSPVYVPNKAGSTDEDRAAFCIDGPGGLNYFYIHTDEYVPKISQPAGEGGHWGNAPDAVREGTIICAVGETQRKITIRQYAAQMVVLYIKYDVNDLMREVTDTFYIERKLEQKNLYWGFDRYWSWATDDLISSGQWDGMKATRWLYNTALRGDMWHEKYQWQDEPAYPEGKLPYNIALAYAINKNRDRDGSGTIDEDEILWYLPAVNELQAVYESLEANDDDSDRWVEDKNEGHIELDEENTDYHSSTPSAADPDGLSTGRSYYVNFRKGKRYIGLRTRLCNVISCRRYNAVPNYIPRNAVISGAIKVDYNWAKEEDEIMPKPKD